MKAVILVATLKKPEELSTTQVLSEVVAERLHQSEVETELIHLQSHNIPPGNKTNEGSGDEWPKIFKKMTEADIIIFATPIWWGGHSSLLQRVYERMDEVNDKLLETGRTPLHDKVGGMIITGAEDGAEHIIGSISNFMIWNGLTLPPACSVSWLGDRTGKDAAALKAEYTKDPTKGMTDLMCQNLVYLATLIKKHPIPKKSTGWSASTFSGAIGFRSKS